MELNKKNLIILIVILAIVLVAGFFAYKYFLGVKSENNNPADGQNQQEAGNVPENSGEQENFPQIELEAGGVKTEGGNTGGGLIICADKCGDGVCQKTDPSCTAGNMNCTCPETSQECPQDCK